MKEPSGKILVIRGGAIGDFILTLPVFAALRQHFPEAHLEVLGYPHIAQLAQAGALVDEVHSIEARALAGFFARGGGLDEQLTNYFAGFALIISYLYDPDGIFQANVARCSKAQFIAGPHRPDDKLNLHATEIFLKPLERLAIFDADPVPLLLLNFQRSAPNQLALHPGSGSEKKNWPEQNWRQLIEHLALATNLNLLLVGGEVEGDRLQWLAAALPRERIQLAQNLSLAELARRLKCCFGFIGHDSGISHLAAAVGLPTLVLWGDTRQSIWRPRGDHVTVITSPVGVGGIGVETVVAEAVRLFPG